MGRVRGEAVLSGLCSSEARLTGGWINKDALCSQAGHVESSAVTPVSSPFFIFCKKRCLFLSPGVGEGGVAVT